VIPLEDLDNLEATPLMRATKEIEYTHPMIYLTKGREKLVWIIKSLRYNMETLSYALKIYFYNSSRDHRVLHRVLTFLCSHQCFMYSTNLKAPKLVNIYKRWKERLYLNKFKLWDYLIYTITSINGYETIKQIKAVHGSIISTLSCSSTKPRK